MKSAREDGWKIKKRPQKFGTLSSLNSFLLKRKGSPGAGVLVLLHTLFLYRLHEKASCKAPSKKRTEN